MLNSNRPLAAQQRLPRYEYDQPDQVPQAISLRAAHSAGEYSDLRLRYYFMHKWKWSLGLSITSLVLAIGMSAFGAREYEVDHRLAGGRPFNGFDLSSITRISDAPSFAFFAKGGNHTACTTAFAMELLQSEI